MERIYSLFNDFFQFLKEADIEKIEHLTNTEFLSLSERLLAMKAPLLHEKWNISIKDEDLYIFNLSGLSTCWCYTNEVNQFIYGGFRLNGFSEALIQDSDFWDLSNAINKYQPDEKELEFLKKLNWFERQSWGDDERYGCFLRDAGDYPPQIYFYDNSAYFPMSLTPEEYFEAMLASCAVRGWQYFYIDIPDNFPKMVGISKSIVLKDVELAAELLPKLFPEKDFSYHIGRLDYLRERLK